MENSLWCEPRANGILQENWKWGDWNIRYQYCGNSGPPIICVHGFGANCDHWRNNLPALSQNGRAYAIDLLGYGYSDKPDPRKVAARSLYSFENWAKQLLAFIDQVVGEPAFIICNSVGGLAGLQAAVDDPSKVRGVQVMNISLRLLHVRNQPEWKKPFVRGFQSLLRDTPLGELFFNQLANSKAVTKVLKQCYGENKDAVSEELVKYLVDPGLQPGAARVFLDFISYSDGPLPQELLDAVKVPVSILWGEEDPWEPVNEGRKFGDAASVEEFISFPGVGHCPQDEAPQLVNPKIQAFVQRHSS
ncbi:hypothetical protein WJX73_004149 [Symbiochloris irregularis]|uniref:AB hydrolase-1 domain-containing protein n=1 Tax=Symbiochloris irregularis TaxID=706552 RepID=A0AAW1P0F4_9CHLO